MDVKNKTHWKTVTSSLSIRFIPQICFRITKCDHFYKYNAIAAEPVVCRIHFFYLHLFFPPYYSNLKFICSNQFYFRI